MDKGTDRKRRWVSPKKMMVVMSICMAGMFCGCSIKTLLPSNVKNINLGNPVEWTFHADEARINSVLYSMADFRGSSPSEVYREGTWAVELPEHEKYYLLSAYRHMSPYHTIDDPPHNLTGDVVGRVNAAFRIVVQSKGDGLTLVSLVPVYYYMITSFEERWFSFLFPHGKNVMYTEPVPTSTYYEYAFLLKLGELVKEKGMPTIKDNPGGIRTAFHERRNNDYLSEYNHFFQMIERRDYNLADKYLTDEIEGRAPLSTSLQQVLKVRAEVKMLTGDLAGAKKDIDRATGIIEGIVSKTGDAPGGSAEVYYTAGCINMRLGDSKGAIRHFKRFDELEMVYGRNNALLESATDKQNDLDVMKFLVQNGWDVNRWPPNLKWFVLGDAIVSNNPKMVRLLLDSGADLRKKVWEDEDALTVAKNRRSSIKKMIKDKMREQGIPIPPEPKKEK